MLGVSAWTTILMIAVLLTMIIKLAKMGSSGRQRRNNPTPAPVRTAAPAVYQDTGGGTGEIVYFAENGNRNTDNEYRFNFKQVGGSWRAYILRMPSLGSRSSDGHSTHRLWDGDKPYVCWDSPVDTLKGMQAISRVWADSLQEYIATGKKFG